MKGTTILGVVILIMLISIVFVPDLGILILLGLLIGGAFYYSRRKCAKCGKRGTIVVSGTEVVGRVPGFGIVTRTDTVTAQKRQSDGTTANEVQKINRQERVPTTTRIHYKCSACGNATYRDVVSQSSDRGSRPSSRSSRSHSPLRLELMNLRSSRGSSTTP